MIVKARTVPTKIGYINPGNVIVNEGTTIAYVGTDFATVNTAPRSSAVPVVQGATVPWTGKAGILYAIDPTGGNPGIGISAQATLPVRLP